MWTYRLYYFAWEPKSPLAETKRMLSDINMALDELVKADPELLPKLSNECAERKDADFANRALKQRLECSTNAFLLRRRN
jgi:hypothetical protein